MPFHEHHVLNIDSLKSLGFTEATVKPRYNDVLFSLLFSNCLGD